MDKPSRIGGDLDGTSGTGGEVDDMIERSLGGVSERSSSKWRSTGECGEFGELPEGDKGGVLIPGFEVSFR